MVSFDSSLSVLKLASISTVVEESKDFLDFVAFKLELLRVVLKSLELRY